MVATAQRAPFALSAAFVFIRLHPARVMKAREAAVALRLSHQAFAERLLEWIEELQLRPARVVVLEEKLSAEALAERWHIDRSTASRIISQVQGRRKLSRKLVRAPASALESFFWNKKLTKRAKRNG